MSWMGQAGDSCHVTRYPDVNGILRAAAMRPTGEMRARLAIPSNGNSLTF